MKIMTQEEKARRYDEAIERAKNFIENGDEGERTVAESIFAGIMEESENERIRKALISILKSDFEKDTTIYDISVGYIIDWLEKQGWQKPVEWSEEDEEMIDEEMIEGLNNCLDELEKENGWSYVYVNDKNVKLNKVRTWLKSIKDRYTWRPSDEQMGALWDSIKHNLHLHPVLKSLYNDLKKLKNEL